MAMEYIPKFLKAQFLVTPPVPNTSCAGKTIIVTGSNTGLGKEAARHFAHLGASTVILAVRSEAKGASAKKDIVASLPSDSKTDIQVWNLDMASYDSVKAFAARANGLPRLDAVVLNAGIQTLEYVLAEGDESTITVNVIATFLLAVLLLPALERTAKTNGTKTNLAVLSSDLLFVAPLKERKTEVWGKEGVFAAMREKNDDGMSRYMDSKLMDAFAARELARLRPVERGVVINYLTPGWCKSELSREQDTMVVRAVTSVMARSTEVGSRTLVHGATAGEETHGQFLMDSQITVPGGLLKGEESKALQDKVWKELRAKLETIEPKVATILNA
ncbi:hypothetical protein MBLNU457_4492t1 [Dothideomycetes sp. NU457]